MEIGCEMVLATEIELQVSSRNKFGFIPNVEIHERGRNLGHYVQAIRDAICIWGHIVEHMRKGEIANSWTC